MKEKERRNMFTYFFNDNNDLFESKSIFLRN